MHRHMRDRGDDYRIAFVPDPVCWTEAPESLRVLSRQRRRWQRGLAETLWRHRGMFGRPRYGAVGMLALPYFLVFELIGPVFQVASFVGLPIAWALGALHPAVLMAFAVVAILLGVLLSVAALALEEFSFRRHHRGREAIRMLIYAVAENFGYRQLVDWWRLMGLWDFARGKQGWGDMRRRGFAAPTPVEPRAPNQVDSGQCTVDSGSGRARASDQAAERSAEVVGS
jgi:cellulose synthase/poly-beta-1,6-N-acetylglucosamine synthase-like glycosyltransferase